MSHQSYFMKVKDTATEDTSREERRPKECSTLTYHSFKPHPTNTPSLIQALEVFVDDETKLTLHGLQQYYVKLKESEKNRKLFDLLDLLEFNQVVIFVRTVQRCMALTQLLSEQNFPAICIHRSLSQEERLVSPKSLFYFSI